MKLSYERRLELHNHLNAPHHQARGMMTMLAEVYGVSRAYASVLKQSRPINPQLVAQRRASRVSSTTRDSIVTRLKAGETPKQIAATEDCSLGFVYIMVGKCGLPRKCWKPEGSREPAYALGDGIVDSARFVKHWRPVRTQPVLPRQLEGSMIKPPTYEQLTAGR